MNKVLEEMGLSEAQINAMHNMRNSADSEFSDIDDHDRLFDMLFSYARLTNHKLNWKTLPKTLVRSLTNFTDCIRLPLFNNQIRDELREATRNFADTIVNSIQYHIFMQTEFLIEDLKNFDEDAIETSIIQVTRKLKALYTNERVDEIWSSSHSDLQANRVSDSERTNSPDSDNRKPDKRKDNSTKADNRSTLDHMDDLTITAVDSIKSTDRQPHTSLNSDVDTERRLDADVAYNKAETAMSSLAPSAVESATQKSDSSRSTAGRQGKHAASPLMSASNKKTNFAFHDSSDDDSLEEIFGNSNIVVHASRDKSTWTLDKTSNNCRILIVGDSNVRSWSPPKRGISVHCFPGARISDIAVILSKSTLPDSVKSLVVAAGVNNHPCSTDQNEIEMQQILDSFKLFKPDVFFMQIAINNTLCDTSVDQLRKLNAIACKEFGRNFIKLDDIPLSFRDRVHYDRKTGSSVSSKVYSFL